MLLAPVVTLGVGMIATMTSARPRVAIDAHTIGRRATGNETYVRGLISGLAPRDDIDVVALVDGSTHLFASLGVPPTKLAHPGPVMRLLRDLAGPRRRWSADLLHVQYVRPPWCDVPVVCTVHDISFEHFPEMFTRRAVARMRLTIPWSARHSSMVLTGSQHSRGDLLDRYALDADRVRVTAYAADPWFRPQTPDQVNSVRLRLGLPQEYILCVGNLQPRKNLPRLVEAYARLPADRPALVIVGQRAWLDDPLFASVRELRLDRETFLTGYVDAADLPAVYAGATAFAYPSLFEGFGLPVLEAMACGAPTLASLTSSIPEVAGEAALLVDPTDVGAIADGLARLIDDDALRSRLSTAGIQRAAQFSWQRCAQETVEAYRQALER